MVAQLIRPAVRDDPASGTRPAHPLPLHLGASVLVVAMLVVRVTGAWDTAADTSAAAALVLLSATIALFGVLIGSAVIRSGSAGRGRWCLDAVLLVAGAAIVCTEQRGPLRATPRSYPSDEGRLVQRAIAAVAHGHDPYSTTYPGVAHFAGNTPLFGGGGATTFGYPPLSAELGAALGHLRTSWGDPGVVGILGLLATATVCLLVLPGVWRTLGIGVVLGLSPLTVYAVNGHPAMLALPLLCLACARWSRIGASGRLATTGVLQAVALGLAAAAQQLAWFPAIGLLVSLWLVRRGPLGDRAALALAARFGAVAVAAFVVVDLPFLIAGPGSWLRGVLAEFTGPPAVATGQGFVSLALVLRHGGGAFAFFSYATLLALLGLLVVVVLGFRRLAVVVPVVLTAMFLVSIRSQGEYFLLFTPLWVVWAAGTDPLDVAASPPLLTRTRRRFVLAAVLVPALACVVVAVAVPAPLRLSVTSVSLRDGRIAVVRLTVANLTGRRVTAHYYLDPASHLRSPWRVVAGPRSLGAGQRSTLTLRPALLGPERPASGLRVWALSDSPEAMSSAPVNR